MITPAQFAERMREIALNSDQEERHGLADGLLLETLHALGYEEGCDVFHSFDKWYA